MDIVITENRWFTSRANARIGTSNRCMVIGYRLYG